METISELPAEDIQILKAINKLKTTTALELANQLGQPFTEADLTAYLIILEQRNLIKHIEETPIKYKLTGLGLTSIGALSPKARILFEKVPPQKCFRFFLGAGPDKTTGFSACNLSELKEKVETVDAKSLEFHVSRGDLERWLKDVLGEDKLAEQIGQIRHLGLTGAQLRNRLLETLNSRINKLIAPFQNLTEL